ncbi:MAG: CU044_2847 family protein [Trichodesmium sp. MO_231.B1]|nr:CU044_2847 family protein [Trichodesmium sp. MO_231.B1]
MTQLTPIQLDDGTTIYIEATEGLDIPTVNSPENLAEDEEEEALTDKGMSSPERLKRQLIQHAQIIESTIRAYTIIGLNAFKKKAIPNVEKVTLEFGIELGGEVGIPYVTKGTAKSNLKVTVQCSLPKQEDGEVKS